MIVIKDVSRTNSLWDLGSWAVKCIFLRQLWDCQEDAVTMTVIINNLLKECDWVLYTVLSWRFPKPRTFIPQQCVREREKKGKKEKKKDAQARLKRETKTPLIHRLYGILLLNGFELFYARQLEFFIRAAYGRFIKTNCSILTITTTITPVFHCTCLKMNNLKSF